MERPTAEDIGGGGGKRARLTRQSCPLAVTYRVLCERMPQASGSLAVSTDLEAVDPSSCV